MPRYFISSLMSIICLISISAQALTTPRAWVIDTDVGIDDVIAILYILNQTAMPVKAISIEADGNAPCQAAYATIQGILQLAGHKQIPVACGRSLPLRGNHHFPAEIIQAADKLAQVFPTTKDFNPPNQSAKNLLIKTLKSASQPMNILAIGPLTTLAEIIQAQPELKKKVHQVYIMGGAIRVPGNIHEVDPQSANHSAEWNIYIDSYAADILFHSGIALTLVPLDVTQTALIDEDFYQALQNQQSSPTSKLVLTLLTQNIEMLRKKVWYFWDPMAAVIANQESLCHFQTFKLSIKHTPEAQSGATVIDKMQGAKIRICMTIDTAKFKYSLLQGLGHPKRPNPPAEILSDKSL